MIWRIRAAWRLKFKYRFEMDDAWELATVLYYNDDSKWYTPADYVDEEMSYWGD